MFKNLFFRALDVLRPWHDRNFMPATDSTSYDPMFKDDYHDEAILNSLNDENPAVSWMEAVEADTTQGRQHIIPKRVGRNWSVGSIGAKGALPQAGRSSFVDSKIDMRDVYLRVGIDRYTMNRARNNKGAFKQALALEMETSVEDCAFARNRMAWGYGAGVMAKVSGVHNAVTTIELKDPGGVTGTVMANRYIHGDANGGMYLGFLDSGTFALKATATVVDVNPDGTDIDLDVPVTLADGDLVVIAQRANQTSFNKEPEGFLASVDDGTYVNNYHDVNRTTFPIEQASVFTGVGALSLDAIQQWIDSISIKVGKTIDMFGYEHAVARAYLALLEADRRYATDGNLMNPDGGTKRAKRPGGKGGPVYGNIPSFVDRDAPFGMAFGFKKDTFIRLTWPDTGWADEGGAVLKWIAEYDEYTAFWKMFENPHALQPARNFRAEGIQVNQLIVRSF